MSITIKKIAELANVSTGTVDRVLNNRGNVRPEVEKRVKAIAKALNYRPNAAAKYLAQRKTPVKIGVVLHVDDSFVNFAINESVKGIMSAAEEIKDFGITVEIKYCSNFNAEHQVMLIDELIDEGASAIALLPINEDIVHKKLKILSEKKFPVFCFMHDIDSMQYHTFIGIDYYKSGFVAAGLFNLINEGITNLAILYPSFSMLGNTQRMKGFKDAIARYYPNINIKVMCEVVNDDIESYCKVKSILSKFEDINSIWFVTGAVDGGLRALSELGKLGCLKIISVDASLQIKKNMEAGYIAATISQEPFEQGYRTIKVIFDYIITGNLPKDRYVYIDSQILIKESLTAYNSY